MGPAGSGAFGTQTFLLPNGNLVVTDPLFDLPGPVEDVGAVYLYDTNGELISRLTGSHAGDEVGSEVRVLPNGHFIVRSYEWNGGARAVTWGSAVNGFGASEVTVSAANSLIGDSADSPVEYGGIVILTNSNYVVLSSRWDNGSLTDAGAATWCSGSQRTVGRITPSRSLVGTRAYDSVGTFARALTNGHYVVASPFWANGGVSQTGAVTWCDGFTGRVGAVTTANSLVGSASSDRVGDGNSLGGSFATNGVTALTNGNYVVRSLRWNNGGVTDVGAVTWGNGTGGTVGPVSATNSLVGSKANDRAGYSGVTALTHGHYVVGTATWDNGAVVDAGAATWGNGNGGTVGAISAANSLVGSSANDNVGINSTHALKNGHYVVRSPNWDNGGTADTGALTWGDGNGGTAGVVNAANSLVGAAASEKLGNYTFVALPDGNYVVNSPLWANGGATNAGAVVWCNGNGGTTGPVSSAIALVGSTTGDNVGSTVTPLTNGHYVVCSPNWSNGAAAKAGAVTWCNSNGSTVGAVSAANSLVGTSTNDLISEFADTNSGHRGGVLPLPQGHYVVRSQYWDNGAVADAGAATWCDGNGGTVGPVSAANSLVGTQPSDRVGGSDIVDLQNGNYLVLSQYWDNGGVANVGAATWCNGEGGTTGNVSAANSLVGSTAEDQVGGNVLVPTGPNITTIYRDRSYALSEDFYLVTSFLWDAPGITDAGAFTLANSHTGLRGTISPTSSVIGGAPLALLESDFPKFDANRQRLIAGIAPQNRVVYFSLDRIHTLAKGSGSAPGAIDIAYGKQGMAAISATGAAALFDSALLGAGASKGRNRAVFAFDSTTGNDLVMQSGTLVPGGALGLPSNAVATAFSGLVFQQAGRGVFQVTMKGSGISATNNRLLLLDNGAYVQPLRRTGQAIGVGALTDATPAAFLEVLQAHDQDLIALPSKFNRGPGGINGKSDSGIVLMDHAGVVLPNVAAREGSDAFGGGGDFGQFNAYAAAALYDRIHFGAMFVPDTGKPASAVFRMSSDGTVQERVAQAGDLAPGLPVEETQTFFKSFSAISQLDSATLVKATLKGGPSQKNEGLWLLPGANLMLRKGDALDPVNAPGVVIQRIVKFWPVGGDFLLYQAQLTGPGVTKANNQVVVLLQEDGSHLVLARTGQSMPGMGPGESLRAISSVEVNTVSGYYAILGSVKGAPSKSNQALWTGCGSRGNLVMPQLRLPRLALRKGDHYSSAATPKDMIRSLQIKPALEKTGAGGRGLAQAMAADGHLAVFITGDRKQVELVILAP